MSEHSATAEIIISMTVSISGSDDLGDARVFVQDLMYPTYNIQILSAQPLTDWFIEDGLDAQEEESLGRAIQHLMNVAPLAVSVPRFEIVEGEQMIKNRWTKVWRVVEWYGSVCKGGRGTFFKKNDAENWANHLLETE